MNQYEVDVVNALGTQYTFKVDGESKEAVRKELEEDGYQVIGIELVGADKTK